jgi:hypothetical protein
MKIAEAEELLRIASQATEEVFNRDGCVEDMILHFGTEDGKEIIVKVPLGDKNMTALMVQRVLEVKNAVWCIMITESWALRTQAGQQDAIQQYIKEHGSIADHPDRREIIAYIMEDEELGMVMAEQEISRCGEDARLAELRIIDSKGTNDGRFVVMLPRRGTKH